MNDTKELAERSRVKPLEWESRAGDWIANSAVGYYLIVQLYSENGFIWRLGSRLRSSKAATLEAAKAAAQADYETRILSALNIGEPTP